MKFIRHLVVLGALAALAMASPPTTKTTKASPYPVASPPTTKIEWCHVEKLDLSPNDVASHNLQNPLDYPATDGVCIPPINTGTLYDYGCPCFNENDLDALLSLANASDYCSYYEEQYPDSSSWSLSASFYGVDSSYNAYRSISVTDSRSDADSDSCSMNAGASEDVPCPLELYDYCGYASAYEDASAMLEASVTFYCKDLIEAVKVEMQALGCQIERYCSSCVNGNCTDTLSCSCYPGWMGDNCDKCGSDTCVNGNCTDTGCACNDNWAGYICTECEYGWTGDSCDKCDPSVCFNGNCTDTGCACYENWTGTFCDSCDVGWTGPNCDACDFGFVGDNCGICDPNLCAGGLCPSCMYGACNSTGCTCDTGWYGDKCDRAYPKGCPCFDAADVSAFLKFAAVAGANLTLNYCSYSEYGDDLYLSAVIYTYERGYNYYLGVTATQCSSPRTASESIGYFPIVIDAGESAECKALIANAGAKTEMVGANCSIYEDEY